MQDGTAYPAVLMLTGENDGRVDPMHSRKMAARLQAATASTHPDPARDDERSRARHRFAAERAGRADGGLSGVPVRSARHEKWTPAGSAAARRAKETAIISPAEAGHYLCSSALGPPQATEPGV